MASPKKQGPLALNLLTSLFLLGALLLVAYFGFTFANPFHALNPLQPPTPAAAGDLNPTESHIDPTLPAADAPDTPSTATANQPTETATLFPTATDVVRDTPEPVLLYVAQEGTPNYLPYSGGCTGLYVAGYVTDQNNNPVMRITVRAEGRLDGEDLLVEVLSGSNTDYTTSGWEIQLSDGLTTSRGSITIALYEQGSQGPVSEVIAIDTFEDCTQNLAVINFIQE